MERFLEVLDDNDANENDENKERKEVGKSGAKHGTSNVWKWFDKVSKTTSKCRICKKIYKTSGNTSNLREHQNRVHPNYAGTECKKSTIKDFFKESNYYEDNNPRKNLIDNAVISMIVTDMQPTRVVDDVGFRNLLGVLEPRYKLPSRTTFQNVLLVEMFDNAVKSLKTMLNNINYCSITSDGWTSKNNINYLTVTCHFIVDGKLKTAVLSTNPLNDDTNHSGENIASSIRHVLTEWKIFDKVTTIVTDNAQSMVKACRLLKKCHLPCFAHSLNLVMQDVLSHDNLKELISKCKKIVAFFKSSSIAYAKFCAAQGENPLCLVQEVTTRWNSAYKMISRILATKDAITSVILKTHKAPSILNADEIELLEDLDDLFCQMDDATKRVSAGNTVTISLILPIIYGLLSNIKGSIKNLKTEKGAVIANFLLDRLRERIVPYENRSPVRKATLLDARFKKEAFRSASNAEASAKLLQDELAAMKLSNPVVFTDPSVSTLPQTADSTQLGKRDMFGFLKKNREDKIKSQRVDTILTMRQYFEDVNIPTDSDPLEYWQVTIKGIIVSEHYS
ncbi:zinc finger BED domain-containing protein 1-like [Rhagoletis pomonella]|uniref:zinc finger BED domain-containing protein 1-like n=1 Tax=Rhagoletis pomonella TaxID=28610 RepID=UPI00177A7C1A|nr:zinc finger BED domain-containing protein 1-like [Rhagoletis pomonella]